MMLLLQVRGNGATNIHHPKLDNPGSCLAENPLTMELDNYLGRQSGSVNHLRIRCGHVRKGVLCIDLYT